MCPYSELLCSAFSFIRTEYGEIRCISPYSVQIQENADQNNSQYGDFLHNEYRYPVKSKEQLTEKIKSFIFEIHSDIYQSSSDINCNALIYRCKCGQEKRDHRNADTEVERVEWKPDDVKLEPTNAYGDIEFHGAGKTKRTKLLTNFYWIVIT